MATITISRRFGAGGATLGARIAKRLGYRYLNDELVKEVAQQVGASVKDVASIEKRRKPSRLMSFLEKVVKVDIIERKRKHKPVDVKEYIEGIKEVILKQYEQGNCVIIGRGSHYILQNKPDAIHILLVASKRFRIKFLMDNYGLREDQAERAVERADLIRADFLYYFSQRENHDDPILYTLCLNMDRLSFDEAEDLVVNLVKQRENKNV
ncbi:MAG: hypothetical protein DRG27_02785 [Deltaproteobacteria bacterium]|nr:MAG: hypothetical protein DRG27_02785 [Deltaproteobacteria bacterium]